MENPSKKYFRLSPGAEVRLRYAYFIKCVDVIKNADGTIKELHCTYDPLTKGGKSPDGRKVQGTIHWISEKHSIKANVRMYDRLFKNESPEEAEEGKTFIENINPDSLKTVSCYTEPMLSESKPGDKFQFERIGYFCTDKDSVNGSVIFNRTVTLKDTWAKTSGGN
jgi:glutaminyl-tRNA synthetase